MSADLPRCASSGCPGAIEEGFCNVCGLEGAGLSAPPPGPDTQRSASVSASASAATGSTSRRNGTGRSSSRRTSRASSSRTALGLGLVQVPELPPLDPATIVLADAVVPESRRICPACDEKLRREKGFCPKCGQPYSFLPPLRAGEVVADQYEILGPLAFGGLGWIFLAKDRVLSRWVVLKGLLNARDEASAASAVAERQFLAAVKHANIVGVYNFVRQGSDGYIVMEYVGGRTLRALRKERGPLPPAEAIAYIHRILGAFAYLHAQEPPLIYCDFKPENIMLEGGDVKLIDLGAVRRADDQGGDIYGTRGYSAPEAGRGPSIEGDLFSIARTLAVLILDFKGFQGRFEFTLPPRDEHAVLDRHPSLHALLAKAMRAEPEERFASADEMAAQLAGVLREVVAVEGGEPRAAESSYFEADPLLFAAPEVVAGIEPLLARPFPVELALRCLPGLRLDTTDPAASFLLSQAGLVEPLRRLEMLRHAVEKFPASLEALYRLVPALAAHGEFELADKTLLALQAVGDWRTAWVRGGLALTRQRFLEAVAAYTEIVGEFPGESVPKYALALALEASGQSAAAAGLHQLLTLADRGAIGAAFGLARCCLVADHPAGAAAALAAVPGDSPLRQRAQIALARCLASGGRELDHFLRASAVAEALALDVEMRHRLALEIHGRALQALLAQTFPAPAETLLLGCPLQEKRLRMALERTLRELARLAPEDGERIRLVDRANELRPETFF